MKSLEEIKSTPNLVIKAEADNDGIGVLLISSSDFI